MGTINMIVSIFVLFNFTVINGIKQRFTETPQSVIVVEGENVTIPCRVENIQGNLQWTKDDFGLGTNRALIGYDRYMFLKSRAWTWKRKVFFL